MLHSTLRIVTLLLVLLPGMAIAEIIKIPVGQQQGVEPGKPLPIRGQSATLIQHHYGEPTKIAAAVGEPPISRWEYPGFAVYFEYDHVVHAVLLTTAKSAH
jgi:hypothetical protein